MLLELLDFEHDGHDHFSSLLPTSLNSAVFMPRHDLCIHLSQSSQAMIGPGLGSIPLRSRTYSLCALLSLLKINLLLGVYVCIASNRC